MSTDVGYELGAALRSAADGVQPPLIDLAAIKRGGRRRRLRARAAVSVIVVFVAGVAGVLLVTAPRGYGHTGPPALASQVRTKTIAHVRAFYHAYELTRISEFRVGEDAGKHLRQRVVHADSPDRGYQHREPGGLRRAQSQRHEHGV